MWLLELYSFSCSDYIGDCGTQVLEGFKRSALRLGLTVAAMLLTFPVFALALYWRRDWFARCAHSRAPLADATHLIVSVRTRPTHQPLWRTEPVRNRLSYAFCRRTASEATASSASAGAAAHSTRRMRAPLRPACLLATRNSNSQSSKTVVSYEPLTESSW